MTENAELISLVQRGLETLGDEVSWTEVQPDGSLRVQLDDNRRFRVMLIEEARPSQSVEDRDAWGGRALGHEPQFAPAKDPTSKE